MVPINKIAKQYWCTLQINIWKIICLNCGERYEDMLKLCVLLRWSILSSYLSPQLKYMIFHIFTCILHHLRCAWFFLQSASRKAILAMLSKGLLITWMNLICTPSFSSSFFSRESLPSLWSKISEALAAILSPITCTKDMEVVMSNVKHIEMCRGQCTIYGFDMPWIGSLFSWSTYNCFDKVCPTKLKHTPQCRLIVIVYRYLI